MSPLFDTAVDAFGGVDIAINTVGKVLRKPIIETTEAEYDSMFDINAKPHTSSCSRQASG
jgi:NAD(P)-dependent dehydrogenase (short-subunit alcohol dehydrogenase family)